MVNLLVLAAIAVTAQRTDLYEWVTHPVKLWDLGPRASPSTIHEFTIALPTNNREELERRFWEISTPGNPQYRKFMSFEEVHALVAPPAHVVQPVLDWLRSVKDVQTVVHLGDFIQVRATIGAIEELFQTEMHVYTHKVTGKPLIRHRGKTSVPTHVRPHIDLIEGIHEFPRIRRIVAGDAVVRKDRPAPTPIDGSPAASFPFVSDNVVSSFHDLYNIPNSTVVTAKGATQGTFAQMAADGIPQMADLKLYDQVNGVPAQTYTYNGQKDSTTGLEATLDMQMITSIAVNAPTTFFMQQAWMYTFVTFLLSMGSKSPLVISVSYGWAENNECSDVLHDVQVCQQKGWSNNQYIQNTDAQFMKWGATGRTFVVCSQDEGAPGETNDGCNLDGSLALYPEYPATSPYVLTVGASAVSGSGNNILASASRARGMREVKEYSVARDPLLTPICQAFNCSRGQLSEVPSMLANAIFTTGGGFSQVNAMPSYQAAAVKAYLNSGIALPPSTKFNASNRAYPDISAMGQNVPIVSDGQYTVTGGTSAATPITAGVMTLLNNYLLNAGKAPLGFPNPLLYQMAAASGANAFNLIQSGDNKCTEEACCKYGYLVPSNGAWNPVNGLGTPNYQNMLAYVQKNLH